MFTRIFIAGMLFLFLMPSESSANLEQVRELIDQGKLHQADAQLGQDPAGTFSDWEGAYLAGIIKANGELSVSELERSLLLCKDGCGPVVSRLCAAYYSFGDYRKVVGFFDDNEDKLDDDGRSFGAYWFASLAYLKLGDFGEAEDVIRKAKDVNRRYAVWAEHLRANFQFMKDRKGDARDRLNDVIETGGAVGFSALYARTYQYAMDGDMDKAYSGFTMLKEAHDKFIGSSELLRLLQSEGTAPADGAAERIAGIRYTIQIGTYADKNEMQKMRNSLQRDGWTTFLMSKYVGGKKYWILTVGSFDTVEGAQGSKKILEGALDASLKVIILE
jgi:tetratricopeptide (TPR) repeat protein